MSYRFMRVFVMFDLPTETSEQKRAYRKFRKALIQSGFIMMQESVYVKLALNEGGVKLICNSIKKSCPKGGLVQMLAVTEKQFSKMEILVGEVSREYVNDNRRIVEI